MSFPIVLSYAQTAPLLKARERGDSQVSISLDLNRTTTPVHLTASGVDFGSGETLSWEEIELISDAKGNCFLIHDGAANKIQSFSEELNRAYSLWPTQGAPTFLISGIPMHRVKEIDPHEDTLRKIQAAKPIAGQVLDTSTGLGYTAIEAARTAERVITIELDPHVLEIARQNPWSQELFTNSKIQQVIGDSYDKVTEFPDGSFSLVIHDPPMFSIAGDLYSREFYSELYRVLKPKGRLFHYIGDLDSPSGHRVARGAARRLQEVGFTRVVDQPSAFGLLAYKR